jgi:hypothetical protein
VHVYPTFQQIPTPQAFAGSDMVFDLPFLKKIADIPSGF